MVPLSLRVLLTRLLIAAFAITGLLHPPMMARDARPAMDCHAVAPPHGAHEGHAAEPEPVSPAAPAPMRLDCPLSTLPPLPVASAPADNRTALPWRYAMNDSAVLHTADRAPDEPPPRA